MTRGQAKGTGMPLEDKVRMVCHRVGSMGSIKDIRHRMSTGEERRVHGAEAQRLMVRPLTDKTDGTNKASNETNGFCVPTCIEAGVGSLRRGGLAKSWIFRGH